MRVVTARHVISHGETEGKLRFDVFLLEKDGAYIIAPTYVKNGRTILY